jgi:type I restriction enzyme R subunit
MRAAPASQIQTWESEQPYAEPGRRRVQGTNMDQATHNKIVSFLWGIADDVLRDLFKRGKYPDVSCTISLPMVSGTRHRWNRSCSTKLTGSSAAKMRCWSLTTRHFQRRATAPSVSRLNMRPLLAKRRIAKRWCRLLHTMYVDKQLAGVKAVQTLSRLNRAHPKKHDVFVLDFMNGVEGIQRAFAPYYRTTILAEETDPNKLQDLQAALDGYQVYANEQRDQLVARYLEGTSRDQLDPILDGCVARYLELDEDGQVDFKGKAKAFVRSYDFLGSILPYTNAEWEKLSIFLNMLIPKLPAPKEEDLSKGILETIDMDSYRAEKKATIAIQFLDQDVEIGPVPVEGGGHKSEPELDKLSNILKSFNDQFGTLFTDGDRIIKRIRDDVAPKVAADEAFQNARKNTPGAARIEHDKALARVMLELLKDDTEVYKQFAQNDSFRRYITDMVYQIASE